MEQITTVGIDLAKNVFSLHGVDANGKVALRRTVRRGELAQTVAALPPCVIGMEACSGYRANVFPRPLKQGLCPARPTGDCAYVGQIHG